jgi:hypothetical protein
MASPTTIHQTRPNPTPPTNQDHPTMTPSSSSSVAVNNTQPELAAAIDRLDAPDTLIGVAASELLEWGWLAAGLAEWLTHPARPVAADHATPTDPPWASKHGRWPTSATASAPCWTAIRANHDTPHRPPEHRPPHH